MKPLDPCCQREADANLHRHRAVAICDGCGRLLLAYGDREDYEHTVQELQEHQTDFTVGESSELLIIAKER